ncbi:MAG: sensor histidine kinase [Cyanobacteriota bacterium]
MPTTTASSSFTPLDEVETVCQEQVKQLTEQPSILGAWIVYRTQKQQRRWVKSHPKGRSQLDELVYSYLTSEAWLDHTLPISQLTQLALSFPYEIVRMSSSEELKSLLTVSHNLKKKWEESHLSSLAAPYFYVYRFAEEREQEYCLVCTETLLSHVETKQIENKAQLLQAYLKVVSDRHRQQETIELLEQALRRGEHQLRNSLALIGLYADNLSLALPPGNFQHQALVIRETITELSAKLQDLLNCGKHPTLQIKNYDIQEIINEVISVLQPQLEAKQIQVSFPSNTESLAVDKWQMKQVFENLLGNAIAFSPIQGKITCRWQRFRHEILIQISDQGKGFSKEDLQNAFTPFYSKRQGGTGLGLAIAKKIILDHRGSIWLENLPEGGALCSLSLPVF